MDQEPVRAGPCTRDSHKTFFFVLRGDGSFPPCLETGIKAGVDGFHHFHDFENYKIREFSIIIFHENDGERAGNHDAMRGEATAGTIGSKTRWSSNLDGGQKGGGYGQGHGGGWQNQGQWQGQNQQGWDPKKCGFSSDFSFWNNSDDGTDWSQLGYYDKQGTWIWYDPANAQHLSSLQICIFKISDHFQNL